MNHFKPYYSSFFIQAYRKCKGISMLFLLLFFNFYTLQANEYYKEISLDPINTFDDAPVEIIVKGYLRFEADVIITDKHLVYINVEDLFKNLGISCVADSNGNILKGFIENENTLYSIDFDSKQIKCGEKTIKSINGIIKESGSIYVETSVLNEAFGLKMLFNFRSLSISLEADFELPMLKQARLNAMRQNISKLQSKNEVIVDTFVDRNYHLFKGGTMDWSVSSFQMEGEKIKNSLSLGLGGELLYGEANIAFNYYDQTKFDKRQLYYNWRWIDNDNDFIKQAQLGKISTQSIAFLRGPLVGASFNNSPNTIRKATGTYIIRDYTEANWTVELYINDVLVDYTEADASGLYVFKVPIVYGYTTLKCKFYGPSGEVRTEERTMNTPYTFMPAKVMEYNVTGGVLQDEDGSVFGHGVVNYGVNRIVTIGGGIEYLSSITKNPYIPFANISFQPISKMVVNMEYAHNVRVKGLLNYYFGRSALLEIDYSKYVEGQQATLNNANEERKIGLSLPLKINKISGNAKLSYTQYMYTDAFNFNQFDAVISGRYRNYSANASLASNWTSGNNPYMTSTLVFSRRMRNGLTIRPSLQYNITENTMMRLRAEVEKRISKMSFSASYERNIQYGTNNVFVNLSFDLPFARAGFTSAYSNNRISFSENAQGSLMFGGDNGVVKTGANSALGKGGILIYPFLDVNHNGVFDKGEHMVKLSTIKISGGRAIFSEKDSIVRIPDLNAFTNYILEFKDNDLENIAWRFKNKIYSILVDPNQFKRVDIPIIAVGEVSGMAYMDKGDGPKGIGRILVNIYRKYDKKLVTTILSESDGYLYYLGLNPGEYIACVDSVQLSNLGFTIDPPCREFTIKKSEDGDMVGGLDFTLRPANDETPHSQNIKENLEKSSTSTHDSISLPDADPVQTKKAMETEPQMEEPKVSPPAPETIPDKLIPVENLVDEKPQPTEIENPVKVFADSSSLKAGSESIPVETETLHNAEKMSLPVVINTIDQQEDAEKNAGDNTTGKTIYKIQLLALSSPLKDGSHFARLQGDLPGIKIEVVKGDDGKYRYFVGNFNTQEEATEFKKALKKLGWNDCFTVRTNIAP